ncbi:hypothetical protein ACEPPN_000954 [Leptodophora sp. 'Broadleaf-Isolate-01']
MLKTLVTSGQLKGKVHCGHTRMETIHKLRQILQQLPNDSLFSMSSGTPNDHGAYDDGVPMPAQQPTDALIPVSGPMDGYNYDASDDDVDPTDQLLRESWMDNGCTSPDTQTYNPTTPPQSSKDVSVPLESQQLSVPNVTGPGENVNLNARSHTKTRARTRHAIALEEPREVDKTKPRKTRTKHYVS